MLFDSTLPLRFWSKVYADPSGCWLWRSRLNNDGYPTLKVGQRQTYAHRLAYVAFVGIIPDGLSIDHLCRVRRCVNPAHLEAVSQRVNALRGVGVGAQNAHKTACSRGHPFDLLNTYIRSSGGRVCRWCDRDRHRQRGTT